ncbi:MAG: SPOR domain-containing protein [Magnetococcales bacterium]|nr:SPOR domain-containing protein [Magnetococcales bacterium]
MSLIHRLLKDLEGARVANRDGMPLVGSMASAGGGPVLAPMIHHPERHRRALWWVTGAMLAAMTGTAVWQMGRDDPIHDAPLPQPTRHDPVQSLRTGEEPAVEALPDSALPADHDLPAARLSEVNGAPPPVAESGRESAGRIEAVSYAVLTGTFPDARQAELFRTALALSFEDVRVITPRDRDGRVVHQVLQGRFTDPMAAREAATSLAGRGLETVQVIPLQSEVTLVEMDGSRPGPDPLLLPPAIAVAAGPGLTAPGGNDVLAAVGGEEAQAGYFVYVVQVASFREADRAAAVAEKYREKGYNPFILKLRGMENHLWHSVCFGLFTQMESAKGAVMKFKDKEGMEAFVLPVESGSFFKFLARKDEDRMPTLQPETPPAPVAASEPVTPPVTAPPAESVGIDKAGSAQDDGKTVPESAKKTLAAPAPREPVKPVAILRVEPARSAGSGNFAIQVGAYLEKEGANLKVEELRDRGHEAYILLLPNRKDPERSWHTVRVGRFQTLEEADAALASLRSRDGLDGYVARINSLGAPQRPRHDADPAQPAAPLEQPVAPRSPAPAALAPVLAEATPSLPPPAATRAEPAAVGPSSLDFMAEPEHPASASKPAPRTTDDTLPRRDPKPLDVTGATLPVPPAANSGEMPFIHRPQPLKDSLVKGEGELSGAQIQSRKFLSEALRTKDGGETERAVGFAEQALALDPKNHRARELLARLHADAGRGDVAYRILSEGVALEYDAGVVKLFSRLLIQDGKVESALGVLEKANQQEGAEDLELQALLAALYQRNKDHWKAIDIYEKLLAKRSDNAIWWMGLGISLEGVEENGASLQAYQNALETGQLKLKLKKFVEERIKALSN